MRTLIVLVVLIVIVVVGLVVLKYQGVRASSPEHLDVDRLSLDRIAEIGARSASLLGSRTQSGGRLGRAVPRAAVRRGPGGTAEWDVLSRGGVMRFRVEPRPNAAGLRVVGAATQQRLAVRGSTAGGVWGLSSAIWDGLCRLLGIPKHPGLLLAQRKRVFRAIARADAGGGA